MANLPLVSVIMPVYNGARFLAASLESALQQDYPAVEVVVVDDGSTDNTQEILNRYTGKIRVLRQQNQGAAVARNTAMKASRGDYLAFLDADDLWCPHKLRLQVEHLERNPNVDLVYSNWMVLEDLGGPSPNDDRNASINIIELDHAGSGWLYNALLLDCIIHTTTVVMRRRLHEQVGYFDPELRRGQDYDYWLRASRLTPISKMRAALSIYRLHETNSTRRPVGINYAGLIVQRALDKWGRTGPDGTVTSARPLRLRLARTWASFGYQHARAGNVVIALHAFARSIAKQPLQPRVWALALTTAMPGAPRLLRWR